MSKINLLSGAPFKWRPDTYHTLDTSLLSDDLSLQHVLFNIDFTEKNY